MKCRPKPKKCCTNFVLGIDRIGCLHTVRLAFLKVSLNYLIVSSFLLFLSIIPTQPTRFTEVYIDACFRHLSRSQRKTSLSVKGSFFIRLPEGRIMIRVRGRYDRSERGRRRILSFYPSRHTLLRTVFSDFPKGRFRPEEWVLQRK